MCEREIDKGKTHSTATGLRHTARRCNAYCIALPTASIYTPPLKPLHGVARTAEKRRRGATDPEALVREPAPQSTVHDGGRGVLLSAAASVDVRAPCALDEGGRDADAGNVAAREVAAGEGCNEGSGAAYTRERQVRSNEVPTDGRLDGRRGTVHGCGQVSTRAHECGKKRKRTSST